MQSVKMFQIYNFVLYKNKSKIDKRIQFYGTRSIINFIFSFQLILIYLYFLFQVCEERNCENMVFHVACNFFDRFLCTTVVQRSQLQLLGCSCLLLASKLRQTSALSVPLLVSYTADSVTQEEIRVSTFAKFKLLSAINTKQVSYT